MRNKIFIFAIITLFFVVSFSQIPSARASEHFWYDEEWLYRKEIPITPQTGAGLNYQLNITGYYDDNTKDIAGSIDFEGLCREDFFDVIFTSENGVVPLDFWTDPEFYISGTSALFWVEVKDSCSVTGTSIFAYFGNADHDTDLSNGDNTFIFFDDFENNNLNRWTTAGSYWSTQSSVKKNGDYAAYADSGSTTADRILFYDYSLSSGGIMISAYVRVQEITYNEQKWLIHLHDAESQDTAPAVAYYNDWVTYQSGAVSWEDNTIVAATWYHLDVGCYISGASSDMYLWIDSISKGSKDFLDMSSNTVTGITKLGSLTADSTSKDHWLDDYIVRKWVATEPTFQAPETKQTNDLTYGWDLIDLFTLYFKTPAWLNVDTHDLYLINSLNEIIINYLLLFGGLILIPGSTLYLAKGGKDEMSYNKLFYFLVAFIIGWGLFLGVIFG